MPDLGSILGAAGIGGNIGKAIVQLELDTKKYAAEMKTAEAQTVTSTNKLGSGFQKFSGLASTAFLGIGVAAVAGLGAAVGAAIEAQEAQQRLHNTIENAPQLTAASEQAFLKQAEAIREVTGADDEAIISGEALLGNMGLTEDAILRLTPRVVDLAAKYDIDLQTAFKAVGKAATGSTGALSRYVGAIEAGDTPAENLAAVLGKLGGAAGFAAEQAKNEPWRLLKSDLEELAEDIGTSLLPVLREVAGMASELLNALQPVLDVVSKLGPAIHVLGEAFQFMLSPAGKVIGVLSQGIEPTQEMVDLLGKSLPESFGETAEAAGAAREKVNKFAHMTGKELQDWRDKTVQSFGDFVLALDESAEHTKITRKEFRDAVAAMLKNSRDLSQAMRTLSREKWVNDEFIQFLSEQGPEWLIGFANLNKEQQKKFQDDWERSNEKLKNANDRFDTMIGLLHDLDNHTTQHTVKIKYEYVNFDPSKPGMSRQQK